MFSRLYCIVLYLIVSPQGHGGALTQATLVRRQGHSAIESQKWSTVRCLSLERIHGVDTMQLGWTKY
jgi:hypothetical protein